MIVKPRLHPRGLTLIALLLLPAATADAREIQSLDFDWRFSLGDAKDAARPDFDDTNWRALDVPHDWSIEGEYKPDNPTGGQGGYLPAGIGWYRRAINVPPVWAGQHVAVMFDGVFSNSTVWLNGEKVGERPYGYISFECDLTPHLRPGRNVLAVRVDNSLAPGSRWYTGAGIYGHVWLSVANPIRIATWGTFVRTPQVSAALANVAVTLELRNDAATAGAARVESTVYDPAGAPVSKTESDVSVASRETKAVEQRMNVPKPQRWSPDTPHLYTLVSRVIVGGAVRDEQRTTFGIRSIQWDKDRGFLLNGEAVKLRGVCLHHDGGPVGAAIPDGLNERRLRQLKAMGTNAIRTAHNPRTPYFYDLCDRLGVMVMDEIFDGWHKKADHDYGAHHFAEWWRRDVTDWVRRDRNHPCVVIYSIGNETGQRDINGITPVIHALDATRPTTGGTMMEGVDVVGLNGPGEATAGLNRFRAKYPDRPFVLTEEPHTYQTRGFYRVLSWWRDRGNERDDYPPYGTGEVFTADGDRRYNSSYDNATIRQTARGSWRRTGATPWIAGEFRWVGFDYLGEAGYTAGGYPARAYNQGVLDLAGLPKDHYFFYQSVWTQPPMVHLLPHWTHPGLEGKTIPVVAYSNCDEVELFLNGRSLGRQPRRESLDFVWQVPYAPGELRGVGYRGGKAAAEFVHRTAGTPARIRLESDNPALAADRRDIAVVTFAVTDPAGLVVPWARNRFDFKFAGPIRFLGAENGDPLDTTPHRIGWRSAFAGLGRAFFQASDATGPIEIAAAAILGERRFEESTTVAFDVQRLALRGALPPAGFELHYTTNGTEPTAQSPRFTAPFDLTRDTKVRALVLRDGRPFMTLAAEFKRELKRPWTDPRYEASGVTVGAFPGPFDRELVGRWKEPDGVTELRADGVMLRQDSGERFRAVGWWWYDFPNDVFEAAGSGGRGELRWNNGRSGRIELTSPKAEAFILQEERNSTRYERVSSPGDGSADGPPATGTKKKRRK